jgi:hypothetical protein
MLATNEETPMSCARFAGFFPLRSAAVTRSYLNPTVAGTRIVCCKVFLFLAAATAIRAADAQMLWGSSISATAFATSLQEVTTAAFSSAFEPLRNGQPVLDKRNGLDKLFSEAEGVTTSLPGASLCGYLPTPVNNSIHTKGTYRCVAIYSAEQAAYVGWKEVADLLFQSKHWTPPLDRSLSPSQSAVQVVGGKLDLTLEKAKQMAHKGRFPTAPWLEFRNTPEAAVARLYVTNKAVILDITNANLGEARFGKRNEQILADLANTATDEEFGIRLKKIVEAGAEDFHSLRGEFDIKKNSWPLTMQLFCGENTATPECLSERLKNTCRLTGEYPAFYTCVIHPGLPYQIALEYYEAVVRKVARATGLPMHPLPLASGDPNTRLISFWDKSATRSITVTMKSYQTQSSVELYAIGFVPNPPKPTVTQNQSGVPIELRATGTVGQNPVLTVKNSSAYNWRVSFNGPSNYAVSVAPGGSQTITLVPGTYSISGQTDAHVIPFSPASYNFPQDVEGTLTITVN